ncbi:biorientation of chromosomes in cell division protein 1-like 1 isoform X1 [Channa argus]|uniref:biorientation of chromosomes in cell division protein 1-like 1 isoform X1 n=1 Tax=Channa argus TaxID=215402 RepID=UPI002944F1B4|nr:hypothetical protein Q8A73_011050 [Channa argus]
MAGLPPGDPQLVSMIVSYLKTQGLFDQFRRDCLADVDTKPAYLNLKQRVDNFVSNHLSNHTWSPHLNKNQLRNNIRQLVLQSGMLEQGVDRIVAQVVDPKINHMFRPQVERVVREFLSPGSCSEEPQAPLPLTESKPDSSIPEQASSSAASTTAANDAMSILDTITSLNQEASVRACSDTEKGWKGQDIDEPMDLVEQSELGMVAVEEGEIHLDDAEEAKMTSEVQAFEVRTEDTEEQMDLGKEGFIEEVKMEEDESAAHDQKEEEKEKAISKVPGQPSEEKQDDDQQKSTSQAKQKAREKIKEEYSLEDSDLEGLSDITVSSVHTSDLSSFEGESEDEELLSDSSEEGELPSDGEGAKPQRASGDAGEEDKECKPRRKSYVHKPFLYSRYYSDSDDEVTVEERRRSAAKDKEERLLKRQQNRERMEEKRKQKVAQAEEQDSKKQKSGDLAGFEGPRAKEARKERKVLEKKMALSRKRKLDSRKEGDVSNKKKGDTGGEGFKKVEMKSITSKTPQPKLIRNLSESALSDERHRKTNSSMSEDSSETKKLCDKGRTHSFILELEQGSQEALRQRTVGKFDRLSRKELHIKERKEKEGSLSCDRAKLKQKQEKKSEHLTDESQQKEGGKVLSEEKGEKKPKIKSEKKMTGNSREGKMSISDGVSDEGPKDAKKVKSSSAEAAKAEKDKIREKEKDKDKSKEKEVKVEKTARRDLKQLQRPDSAGSSEDRSDMEPGSDSSKKKDKHSKEVLKRSKSHPEDSQGEKPKSKTDNKEIEKEKTKADQDSQKSNKSTSETDKDPKRIKPTEKGRTVEKSKTKSKEETKTSLLSKADKKGQRSEIRNAGAASIGKPETTKEKKKEGIAKEQQKVSAELSQEKSEIKSAKKKLEKDKITEKKDDNQEEKKSLKEEKLEKSDKSSNSSVSSLSLETKEAQMKQSLLQDTSTDSDPVTTTVTTSFSDDTCDALSDITPEPPESETESRLSEMSAVPAEADALLTLVDVCTSAEARLPTENLRENVAAEMARQDDMKMKEAALTLLSMDPDSTVSSSLISQDTRDEPEVNPSTPQLMEVTATEDVQHLPMDVQTAAETGFTATETLPAPPQHVVELTEENLYNTDESEKSEKEMGKSEVETSKMFAPQEDDTTSNVCQGSLNEHKDTKTEIPPEKHLLDELSLPAAGKDAAADVVSEPEEVRGTTGENAVSALSSTTEQEMSTVSTEMSGELEQAEPDVSDTMTSPKTHVAGEEDQSNMDIVESEAESRKVKEEIVEKSDSQMMEIDIPDKTEEDREDEPGSPPKLVKQISNVSSRDGQDDKGSDLSEKEETMEERGRQKRKPSTQKAAAVKKSGDDRNDNESYKEPSAEETEQVKAVEVNSPCTGQSPRTTEETEQDQTKETGKSDETDHRERHSGAPPKEAIAAPDNENKEEKEDVETSDKMSSGKPEEKTEEESAPKNSGQSQGNLLTVVPEDTEVAGSSDSKETTYTSKPAVKRTMSEEIQVEKTQEYKELNEVDSQQEQNEQEPEKDRSRFSSVSPSGEQEAVKEESCSEEKLDDTEEEQQQEDPETTPKRNPRRGRPSKAAAITDDSDKKDKNAEGKKSEQNDEEEEEDGDKEEEEKETATRATTRSASRLEAEKNKPSKPSTRASRQSGKEETAAGTRGTRGQAAAAKGGRKREASPPVVRTRAGQKSEEPPSKRAKR